MTTEAWVNETGTVTQVGTWENRPSYRIHLLITQDDEGTYSAAALNLPGAGSCGDTEEEAVENAKDAIRGVLESYGADIPWKKDTSSDDIPFGAKQKWIIVNV